MKTLLVLPVVIPLCTAAVSLLFWSRRRVQRWCSAAGAAALLAAGSALMYRVWFRGIASTQVGDWPAPFGITFVADVLGAVMVVLAGIVGVAVVGYSLTAIDRRREAFGFQAATAAATQCPHAPPPPSPRLTLRLEYRERTGLSG